MKEGFGANHLRWVLGHGGGPGAEWPRRGRRLCWRSSLRGGTITRRDCRELGGRLPPEGAAALAEKRA
ncbi:proline-rich receptor-like protein kinase PERK9 [Iris pallida]|uniref:Proline-rich receptor-like protein kinase PERK9 n=1 Tax=Iris pallida TaxID=29817 RepID=A0AAX6IMA0_IRIPA|nr:proline-rich receptor-like protein kinase PERK9 [Iris pallida]